MDMKEKLVSVIYENRLLHGIFLKLRDLYLCSIYLLLRDFKVRDINLFDRKVYSQNGEDGILQLIFHKIGVTNRYFVEFGVGNGTICNTGYLREKHGWKGLMMDAAGGNSGIKKEFITAENINGLFRKHKVPRDFDLLSIDIDFNDYWVWKAIEGYSPRVVVIEYNGSVPPDESRAVRYEPQRQWDGSDYYGASLLALAKLARKKGYRLVGCDRMGVNAFFVKDELIKDRFEIKDVSEAYRRSKYMHRPSTEAMAEV